MKGKPDTGPLGEKIEKVKQELKAMDVAWARAVAATLPSGELVDEVALRFDIDEINELAFRVRLEPEDLKGERRWDRAYSLVSLAKRQNKTGELLEELAAQRPSVAWPEA